MTPAALTLPETARLLKAELMRRFPGCDVSVRSHPHSDSIALRWIDGPTQSAVERAAVAFVRPAAIDGALAGAGAVTCHRLFTPALLAGQIEQRARFYSSRKPSVITLRSDGIEHADLAPWDAAGQPISAEDLRPWRYAVENHNAYTPPAQPEPAPGSPAGKLAVVARLYVAAHEDNPGAVVACQVRPAPEGGFWLKFSGAPHRDVRLALGGALNARWDGFRKVWITYASLDRIQAALPAA